MPSVHYGSIVGAVIAKLRTATKIDQKTLSEQIGVSQSTLSKIERGDSTISVLQLAKISNALNVTPSEVLELVQESEKELKEKGMEIVFDRNMESEIIAASLTSLALGPLALGSIVGGLVVAYMLSKNNQENAKQEKRTKPEIGGQYDDLA